MRACSLLAAAIYLVVSPTSGPAVGAGDEMAYVLEAEAAGGEWQTGLVSYSDLSVAGAYVSEASPNGAQSSLSFAVAQPGYYLIGARFHSSMTGTFGRAVAVYLRQEGNAVLPNVFEASATGQGRFFNQGGWTFPVFGLWQLAQGTATLTFRALESRAMVIDYFYLVPLFEAKGSPSAILPLSAWPAAGEWVSGMEWTGGDASATTEPGASSSIEFDAPLSGKYAFYVTAWHRPTATDRITIDIESGTNSRSVQIVLGPEAEWQTKSIGSVALDEGSVTIRFASDPENPGTEEFPLAVESFLIMPEGAVLTSVPAVETRRARDGILVDGLGYDWREVPLLLSDPHGDSSLTTDISELKGLTHGGHLYVMVGLHELAEHSYAELEVDYEGDGDREYNFILAPEGGGGAMRDLHGDDALFDVVPVVAAPGAASATWEVIETTVPLTLIENRTSFYIRYLMFQPAEDPEDWFLIDGTDWVRVDPSVTWAAPLGQGWNHRCYVGPEQAVDQALADAMADVQAVYRLNASQGFDRWFAGRPEVSNIETVKPYEPLFVLASKDTAWSQTPSGAPPTSVTLAQGWNSTCYLGQTEPPGDATGSIAGQLDMLYMLRSDQTWSRYVPGRPEVTNIAQLAQYDAVLLLVSAEGGAQWVFNP